MKKTAFAILLLVGISIGILNPTVSRAKPGSVKGPIALFDQDNNTWNLGVGVNVQKPGGHFAQYFVGIEMPPTIPPIVVVIQTLGN